MTYWTVPREWPQETAFIVAGGPSVREQNTEALRGKHVIAINSSYERVPFADYLIFSDQRWWEPPHGNHCHKAKKVFQGKIVSAVLLSAYSEYEQPRKLRQYAAFGVDLWVDRIKPPGLALKPDTVAINWTTLTGAINLAAHLVGPGGRIVLLGADGKRGNDGACHHHHPHKWDLYKEWSRDQAGDLRSIVEPLKSMNIECFNTSLDTAWKDIFPVMPLESFL